MGSLSTGRMAVADQFRINPVGGAVPISIEQMIWDLEVELLDIIDPGYRSALELFVAGGDPSKAVVDPVREAGEGVVG